MPNQDLKHAGLCILHLEDSHQDHQLVKREFQKSGIAVELTHAENLCDFEKALKAKSFDLVLADYRLPGFTALDAWQLMKARHLHLPFILLSGAIGESAAVQAIQAGISDYLPKSDLSKLPHVIQRALELQRIVLAKQQTDQELALSEKRLANFAQHLQTTIEQERAAIAREIHDDIGGALTAIRFDLSWLQRHTLDAPSLTHIQTATDMLQHAVQASQRIMLNLRPAILDQGLSAAIHWLGNNFANRTGISTEVKVQMTDQSLPKSLELTAYRTAQETLTNVSKYAQCTQVKIELVIDSSFLTLEISDNGCGFVQANIDHRAHYGLQGLAERAKTVGGWLDVSSSVGHGTSITLSIPIDPANIATYPE